MDYTPNGEANCCLDDDHTASSLATPIRLDAFELSDADKIEIIERNFREIMVALGLDLRDNSLAGTPRRVAKMFVQELFSGLNPANEPNPTLFENTYRYGEMLVERNIAVHSMCEHHFVPIVGVAHLAYVSSGKVIGLSKLNRIVRHFARRPQVQERLTIEIANHLRRVLETDDVAVLINARHYCVLLRGVEDVGSSTVTSSYHGRFQQPEVRAEFLRYVELPQV